MTAVKNAESGTFRFPPDVLVVLGAGQKDRGLSECVKTSLHHSATFWGFQIVLGLLNAFLTLVCENAAILFSHVTFCWVQVARFNPIIRTVKRHKKIYNNIEFK